MTQQKAYDKKSFETYSVYFVVLVQVLSDFFFHFKIFHFPNPSTGSYFLRKYCRHLSVLSLSPSSTTNNVC